MTPQQRDTPPPRRTDHTRLNIWLTFAGTVLAALIAGIFAVVVAIAGKPGEPGKAGEAETAATQATAPTGGRTAAPAPAATPTVADGAAPVRWSGPLVASAKDGLGDAVDLDSRPPRPLDDTARAADLSVRGFDAGTFELRRAVFGGPSSFARWDGPGTPDLAQCRDAAGTTGLAGLEAGTVLCVRTGDDRVARLTVRKVGAREQAVTFDAVVWDGT